MGQQYFLTTSDRLAIWPSKAVLVGMIPLWGIAILLSSYHQHPRLPTAVTHQPRRSWSINTQNERRGEMPVDSKRREKQRGVKRMIKSREQGLVHKMYKNKNTAPDVLSKGNEGISAQGCAGRPISLIGCSQLIIK